MEKKSELGRKNPACEGAFVTFLLQVLAAAYSAESALGCGLCSEYIAFDPYEETPHSVIKCD